MKQTPNLSPRRLAWLRLDMVWFAIGAGLLLLAAACGGSPSPLPPPSPTQAAVAQPTIPSPVPQPTATVALPASPTRAPAAPPASATPAGSAATKVPTPTTQPASPRETPLPPPPPAKPLKMSSPEYGMQAFLWWRPELAERDLLVIKAAGFSWVKQTFAWRDVEGAGKGKYDWSHTDPIVYTSNKYGGLDLLIRVDHSPEWAAPGCSDGAKGVVQGPPRNNQDLADFLKAMVGRYKGRIRAYEIWNEPNLAREWCGRTPSAAEYVRLLKVAYSTIKAIDPNAIVITAGLTPTGTQPPVAVPDDGYLEQMYQAMGGKSEGYFDALGAHAAGYKAPPEVSPDEAAADKEKYGGQRFFTFRRVEDLRKIMVKYGDQDKQIAILEFGWTSDPRPDSPYHWHAVTEEQKADYFVRAYQFAKKNWSPWIGVMSLIYIANPDWTPNEEQYYWSITEPNGKPRQAYNALKAMPK